MKFKTRREIADSLLAGTFHPAVAINWASVSAPTPPAPAPVVVPVAGPSEYEWKDIGDDRPVQVQRCDKCGVCPSNVDDCGHFGDSRCPYFGIDAMAAPPAPEGEGLSNEEMEKIFKDNCYTDDFGTYLMQLEDFRDGVRAATLLQQLSAPAPVVVPVAVSERLPDSRPEPEGGDCDAEGFCWNGYGYSYDDENNIDSYAMWMLVPESDLRGEVWAPASAIPLPQAGEGEA
jgi:hypothetical protein